MKISDYPSPNSSTSGGLMSHEKFTKAPSTLLGSAANPSNYVNTIKAVRKRQITTIIYFLITNIRTLIQAFITAYHPSISNFFRAVTVPFLLLSFSIFLNLHQQCSV